MSTIISRSTDASTFEPTLVMPWEAEDEPGTLVHTILGSESVDVTLRPALATTGTMRLLFWTFAEAEAARLMLRPAAIFNAASDLPWMPTTFVPNGPIQRAQQDQNLNRWMLEVPFRDVST